MAGNFKQFVVPQTEPAKIFDQAAHDAVSDVLQTLDVKIDTAALSEDKASFNSFLVAGTSSLPFSFGEPFNSVQGLRSEIVCTTPLELSQYTSIADVRFTAADAFDTPRIQISAGTATSSTGQIQVVFNNCVFVRGAHQGHKPFLSVKRHAAVVFLGCVFVGLSGKSENSAAFGMVDLVNSPPNSDVQFVGCSRFPTGGFYTTHTTDSSGTKTGCLL